MAITVKGQAMARRQKQPKQVHIAEVAAILVLAGCFAAPVVAAPDHDPLCYSHLEATLKIKADTMSTTIDAVADDHVLKPRVEATARKIFTDSANESETEEISEIESDDDKAPAPRLRSLSDNELVPFRRQMYRRDI
jgi:hypothetical protein